MICILQMIVKNLYNTYFTLNYTEFNLLMSIFLRFYRFDFLMSLCVQFLGLKYHCFNYFIIMRLLKMN